MIPTPNFDQVRKKTHPLQYPWKHFRLDLNIQELDTLFILLKGVHHMTDDLLKDSKESLSYFSLREHQEELESFIKEIDDQVGEQS